MPVFDKAVMFMTAQYREHLGKNPRPVFIFGECEDPDYDDERQLMEEILTTVVVTTDWHRVLLLAHGKRMARGPDRKLKLSDDELEGRDIKEALLDRERGPIGLLPQLDPVTAVKEAAAEMIDRVEGMADKGGS